MNSNLVLGVLVVFTPLLGSLLALVFHKKSKFAQAITCLSIGIAFLALIFLWMSLSTESSPFEVTLLKWIKVDKLRANWGLFFDPLSLVMCGVVTLISLLVHIYSLGYMAHDEGIGRFMSYLSLFTFMMLLLVTSPNMAQLFVGWEGVGLASYLLIGFWYEKPRATIAAMKAFIINRVGDAGLILGICAIFVCFESLDFSIIFANLARKSATYSLFWGYPVHSLSLIGVLLFIGVMGKSAQFGLHTWLPDAMEAPTPVSALIHAATMVTAGVFLVARFSPLYEFAPFARHLMVFVGALTAFYAATVALTQNDIKRIIAYSTCSQLGYMILACGCSAYGAAIFHLVTHAFFKALLFLGAGSVIHAMSDEQNIQKMGGIYQLIPTTYAMMWIGSLALAGIPFFAGYYSKDVILSSVFSSGNQIAFGVALFTALLTAFYSWRLLIVVFHGKLHADEQVVAHIHESPPQMLLPLFVLAIGSAISGWLGWKWFIEESFGFSWKGSIAISNTLFLEHSPWVEYSPLIAAILGIFLALLFYRTFPKLPEKLSKGPLYNLSHNKWYIDEIYHRLLVRPAVILGSFFWNLGDRTLIDGFGPEGISKVSLYLSRKNSSLQTGYAYHYAFAMLFGIIALVSVYFCIFYRGELAALIRILTRYV